MREEQDKGGEEGGQQRRREAKNGEDTPMSGVRSMGFQAVR